MLDRYKDRLIELNDNPFWTTRTYLRQPSDEKRFELGFANRAFATPINPNFYIDQFSSQAFVEFNGASQIMRNHGCGIVSLHHVLGTLSEIYPKNNTVGNLAFFALDFHRNDLRDNKGNILKKGTPVLAINVGWYHDALLHVASKFGIEGHRLEGISLECLAREFKSIQDSGSKVLSIISVKDDYKCAEMADGTSHLIVASGFKFDMSGKLSEVMITDPSIYVSNGEYLNHWVSISKIKKDSFLGKAMFFYTTS